jgi:hypothetical protein
MTQQRKDQVTADDRPDTPQLAGTLRWQRGQISADGRRYERRSHGVGAHFDASASRLKCVLVMNGWFKYLGSCTTV